MDFEFETKRTALANAFAAAGADWLGYMGMTDTVVASIPDTQPQKYAVAGTLKGILSMAGKMMGEDGVTGLEGLTRYDLETIQGKGCMGEWSDGDWVKFADVERLLAAPAAAEKPTGGLTDEQIEAAYQKGYDDFAGPRQFRHASNHAAYHKAGLWAVRAAIAAHIVRQTDEPLTIALGHGLIEVGQGHHGDDRLPAILFGRNGAGAVGIETEGNRTMKPGECIAAITFENPQSLDVVAEKLGELRARIWPDAEMLPAKHVIAPHFRGYAHLGIGAYVLNHSAAGEAPELAISVATEEQKAGRVVGDSRDNEPGELVHAKDIAVRLRFENVAGLDALEQQLRFVRSVHFPESASQEGAHLARQAQAVPIPDVLFDGPAVFAEITRHLGKSHCHQPGTVATTLDAVVRLMRRGVKASPAGAQNAEAIRNQWISVKDQLPKTEHECTSRDLMVSNSFYVRGVAADGGEGFGMADYQEDGKWHCYGGDYDFMHIVEVTHYLPIRSADLQTGSANTQEGGDK